MDRLIFCLAFVALAVFGCGDNDASMDVGDHGADARPGIDAAACASGAEQTEASCSDGCSNDGDLFVDCDDWDCAETSVCAADCALGSEDDEEACADGCSNDGDAWVDCDDRDCFGVSACDRSCTETGPEDTPAACADGCSNDGDPFVDCDDWDCAGIGDCLADCASGVEASPSACSDGCSNDGDPFVDCDDWDCAGIGSCTVEPVCESRPEDDDAACSDDCSNDGDGLRDCEDPDCAGHAGCPASCDTGPENTAARCSDGCSNDGDDEVDCRDLDCDGVGPCPPAIVCVDGPENTAAACSDGCSNDGDVEVDCADEDCAGVGSCGEQECRPWCSALGCSSDGCGGFCGLRCGAGEACVDNRCQDMCTGSETRCVAGDPGRMQRCSGGVWQPVSCADHELCSNDECRPVCGLTSAPSDPFLCVVPNRDGVNGPLLMLSNTGLMLPPYTSAQIQRRPSRAAAIVASDPSHAPYWPYEWHIQGFNADTAFGEVAFRLDQLASVLGAAPHELEMRYATRRQPRIQVPTGDGGLVTVDVYTRTLLYAFSPSAGAYHSWVDPLNHIHYGDPWVHQVRVFPGAPDNRFDYGSDCSSGPCNSFIFGFVGEGGLEPMDVWVNWMLLYVR